MNNFLQTPAGQGLVQLAYNLLDELKRLNDNLRGKSEGDVVEKIGTKPTKCIRCNKAVPVMCPDCVTTILRSDGASESVILPDNPPEEDRVPNAEKHGAERPGWVASVDAPAKYMHVKGTVWWSVELVVWLWSRPGDPVSGRKFTDLVMAQRHVEALT